MATRAGLQRMGVIARINRRLQLAAVMSIAGMGTLLAQVGTATLTGIVLDATGAVLPGATVKVVEKGQALAREVQSGRTGEFVLAALPPGEYVVSASLSGFQPLNGKSVVLNVDDRVALRLVMSPAGVGETVTVSGEGQGITTSPSVSTVIDRTFVQNLPLNGRSLHALLELTPGVSLVRSTNADPGQFSVNGQRATANYFTIDGVSANAGMTTNTTGNLGAAASGQLPALTTLGTTNGLVSIDALQEFRIHTSTYAPEFGRVPGGQVSLVTRSGTNVFSGSVFESFRDESLDANDWFVNKGGADKPEMRQHNFGGVIGGPLRRDKTFVFGAYERLELLLPRTQSTSLPTLALRQSAPAEIRQFLNVFPLPNGRELGNGFGEFLAVYSNPSQSDSTSVRVDHNAASRVRFFGRVSDAPSSSDTRVASFGHVNVARADTQTATVGSTWLISGTMVQDLRANYTETNTSTRSYPDTFGGASGEVANLFPSGRDPQNTSMTVSLASGPFWAWGRIADYRQHHFNLVASLTKTIGSHEVKGGIDYRAIVPTYRGGGGTEALSLTTAANNPGIASQYAILGLDERDRAAQYDNVSTYLQDNWRWSRKGTLSYGVRWEIVPPPRTTKGLDALVLDHLDNPYYGGPLGVSPVGTSLWKTKYTNIAPRIGGSYVLSDTPGRSLVIRSGVGIFHDLGYGVVANAFGGTYPFAVTRFVMSPRFPLAPEQTAQPTAGIDAPTTVWLMDPNLDQPYTVQWNVSADQSLWRHNTLTVSYVGANGQRLLRADTYQVRLVDWPTATRATTLQLSRNNGYSDYQALQVQFTRRLHRGIQGLTSYSFARSRDTDSSDATLTLPREQLRPELNYGYSSYDVRHVITGALTYEVGDSRGPAWWRALSRAWGINAILRARTGYPINITAFVPFPPDTTAVRVNVVSGEPFWLDDPSVPGGRRLNARAFRAPSPDTQGNLLRGAVRGFGARQVDLAVRRELRVWQRLRVQLRLEAFNVFNTPNFADPSGTASLASSTFGLADQMLNRGLGGLNALHQIGGPRSIQLSTKVMF